MMFGPVPLAQAEGAILAHSVALEGGGRIRKGRVLDTADIARLAGAGISTVTVARLLGDDLHEDAAATALGQALIGAAAVGGQAPPDPGIRLSVATTGRVNLYATRPGVAQIDAARVRALNAVDPTITFASTKPWAQTREGTLLGTVKIISYGVSAGPLARAAELGRGAMRVRPVTLRRAQLIVTRLDHGPDTADSKGITAIRARLEALGMQMAEPAIVAHDAAAIAVALGQEEADLRLILTASATSDIRDVAPQAVVQAGGSVSRFGMPVDPGNLLFLGEIGVTPVIGLPGCARSPALNGVDFVLSRVACGLTLGPEDFADMAVGGLLKEIPQRGRPREADDG